MGLTVVQAGSDKEDAMVINTNPPEGTMVDKSQPVTVNTLGGGGGDGGGDNNNGNPGGGIGGFFG
jgi:serine/threonine-protein kinase